MKKIILSFSIFISATSSLTAQTVNANNKLAKEFTDFFTGNWTGEGAFASGRKISADLSFKLSLDSSWLVNEHTDKFPNQFKSQSMWGVDVSTGEFVAYLFDNFQGHRKFLSEGWIENKLVLTTTEFYTKKGLFFQHFIYERLSEKSFKMTFETSKDGITWKLIDYLVFTRK